ncbi:MAG: xanthine dehydrogenase accessory protein XdhC [Clostridia bacterium]
MRKLLGRIVEMITQNERAVLVSILSRHGSAPREAGAAMLVTQGAQLGTIGGGAIEHAAVVRAREMAGAKCAVARYNLAPGDAAELGMVCGGDVLLLFHPLGQADLPAFTALYNRKREWLVRRGIAEGAIVSEASSGEVGAAWPTFDGDVFTERVPMSERALIFGGGHVGRALAPVLVPLGFEVTVLDDRAAFIDAARFPAGCALAQCDFSDVAALIEPGDYVIVMTRGHEHDYAVLRQALARAPFYLGCIGSRAKVKATHERLRSDGFTDADLARIRSPIGLAIGAQTPEEIAISIAAEVIAARRGGEAARRRRGEPGGGKIL